MRSAYAGNVQIVIGQGRQRTAAAPRQGDNFDAALLRGFRRRQQVRTVSARRKQNQYIAFLAECFDLTGENTVEAIVVANAGQSRSVGAKRQAGQRFPIRMITPGKLLRHVHRLRGTSAITRRQYLTAILQGINQQTGYGPE